MTKEEAFKQFCDEIAKEAPQYAEMMRDNCLIVGSFNRAWEDSHNNTVNNACEWMRTKMNRYTHTSPYGICVMMDEAETALRNELIE